MKRFLYFMCGMLLIGAAAPVAAADNQGDIGYEPTPENLEARGGFQDMKFGMFIHWGVYSVRGRGEWVMNRDKLSIAEYERNVVGRFEPVGFDADEWCRIAKAAGMRYITITSKHHDGFAMWDSAVSDYDIVDRTDYGRDVLKQLADACERHGLLLFFYHSQLDWHHPDYYPRGRTDVWYSGRPHEGDWYAYLDYMDAQLRELCTGYGPIGGIWFDGMWDKLDADWRLGKTYGMIHGIRSNILIGSNHHVTPYPGEDFQMFEKGLPGNDPFSEGGHVSALPLETCETINRSWGYRIEDDAYKSVPELIRYLVRAAGNNANFLLNVGPKPDGTLQPEFVERLTAVGDWLEGHGEAVYGTRGGPVPPHSWGVTTHTDTALYLHIFESGDDEIALPPLAVRITGASLLDGTRLRFETTALGTVVTMPDRGREEIDTVVKLTCDGVPALD